jgi:hypothetical protein
LLNAAVGRFKGKGGDEQTLLRSIQETLEPKDILIGDASFPTFFCIAAMKAKGVDILMEQMGGRKPKRISLKHTNITKFVVRGLAPISCSSKPQTLAVSLITNACKQTNKPLHVLLAVDTKH